LLINIVKKHLKKTRFWKFLVNYNKIKKWKKLYL
jgi:hypothetical protein